MPVIGVENHKKYSELVVFEEERARYSRDDIRIAGEPKVGDLVSGSPDENGFYHVITDPSDVRGARYIVLFNHNEVHGDRYAVLARNAIVRSSAINWPEGLDDDSKENRISSFENRGILVRD